MNINIPESLIQASKTHEWKEFLLSMKDGITYSRKLVVYVKLEDWRQTKFCWEVESESAASSIFDHIRRNSEAEIICEEVKKTVRRAEPLNFYKLSLIASKILSLSSIEIAFLWNFLYEDGLITYPFTENSEFNSKDMVKWVLNDLSTEDRYGEEAQHHLKNLDSKRFRLRSELNSFYLPPIIPISQRDRDIDKLSKKAGDLYHLIVQGFMAPLYDQVEIKEVKRTLEINGIQFTEINFEHDKLCFENQVLLHGEEISRPQWSQIVKKEKLFFEIIEAKMEHSIAKNEFCLCEQKITSNLMKHKITPSYDLFDVVLQKICNNDNRRADSLNDSLNKDCENQQWTIIRVGIKHKWTFYLHLTKKLLLKWYTLELQANGAAVANAVKVAECLIENKYAIMGKIKKDEKVGGLANKTKINIILKKTANFHYRNHQYSKEGKSEETRSRVQQKL